MTLKTYAVHELAGRGYKKFEDIPEEMLDYLPENLEDEENEEEEDFFN